MAPYKNGVIIGKFMPLHAGHRYLIETARAQVENLTVLVCSLENEPIPGNRERRGQSAVVGPPVRGRPVRGDIDYDLPPGRDTSSRWNERCLARAH